MTFLDGLFEKASRYSIVRHFVYALVAAYLIAAVPVVSNIADDMVNGVAISGDDFKALIVATEFAVGTAVVRVIVPAAANLASDFDARAKDENA